MGNIDKRVVEMRFDNQQFEQNVQTSVKSLDTLKKGLNLEQAAKGLDALDRAGRSFSLAEIADSVTAISTRFTTLGIVGVTAIQNIVNKAADAGTALVKSLSVDQITAGYDKYTQEVTAVQSIMNATGKSMDEVQEKLDKLGWFSDETSYSYTTMIETLGKFVSAGGDMDESVSAMEGIANWAAVSGANTDKAAIAFYNLSQAMATGSVRMTDWRSIELASMATEEFKQMAIDAGVANGALKDLGDGNYITMDDATSAANLKKNRKETAKAFEDRKKEYLKQRQFTTDSMASSLDSGWFSKETLTNVLGNYSAYSDKIYQLTDKLDIEAADAMELADAPAEEYTKRLAELGVTGEKASDIMSILAVDTGKVSAKAFKAAQEAKTFTDAINATKDAVSTGWKDTFKFLFGNVEEAKVLWTDLSGYLYDLFAESGNQRNEMLRIWNEDLGGRDDLVAAFYNIMDSVTNIVSNIKSAFSDIFPPMTAETLKNITESIQLFTEKVKAFTENSEKMAPFLRIVKGIAAALDIARMAIVWVWTWFKKLVNITEPAGGSILEFVASIGDFIVGIRDSIKNSTKFQTVLGNVGKAIESVKTFVIEIGRVIGKVFGILWEKGKGSKILTKLGDAFSAFVGHIPAAITTLKGWGKAIVQYFRNSEFLQKTWTNLKNFAGPAIEKIKAFAIQFKEALKTFFSVDTSGITGFWEKLKARFTAVGGAFPDLFDRFKKNVVTAWDKLKTFLSNLFGKGGADASVDPNKASIFASLIEQAAQFDWKTALLTIGGVLAGAKVISLLRGLSGLGKGLKSIGDFLKNFKETGKISFEFTDIIQNQDTIGNNMLKMAGAIAILVGAIVVLANMNDASLKKGLGVLLAISIGLVAVAGVFKLIGTADSKGMVKVAASLALLAIPVLVFGNMPIDRLTQGIVTILGLLIGLSLFSTYTKGLGKSTGLIATAIALNLLIIPIKVLGGMDIGQLALGLLAIGVLLTALQGFSQQTKGLGKSSGLIATAIALNLLIIPIKVLGGMDVGQLIVGLFAIGVLLTVLQGFLQQSKGLGKSSGLIATAMALNLLIIPIKVLGGMDVVQLGVGLGVISALLFGLGLFNKKTKGLGKSSGLIATAIALNLLVIPIQMLGKMKLTDLAKGVGAVSALLIMMGVFNKLSSGINLQSATAQFVGMIGMAGLIIIFAESLSLVKDIPWQTIAAFSGGIVAVVTAMVAATLLLKNVDPGSATQAAAALAIIATGLGAAIAIIARFVGNAAEGLSDNAVGIASNLQLYSDSASKVDYAAIGSSITAIKDIAGMMEDIGGKSIGNFNDFSGQLTLLSSRLGLFNLLTSGIAAGGVDNAVAMVEDIEIIADKMVAMQAKGINLFVLGTSLALLGGGIKLYSDCVVDANAAMPDGGKTKVDSTALTSLFESLDDIDLDESVIANVAGYAKSGGTDIAGFGAGLEALGVAITSYKESIKSINLLDAVKSGIVLTMINDLQNNLPVKGNDLFTWFNGSKQTLGDFAEMLTALGGGVQMFSSGLANYDSGKVDNAVAMIRDLVTIQGELQAQKDKMAGFIVFGNTGTLAELGKTLITLGNGFNDFITALSQFAGKQELVTSATAAIKGLTDIQVSLMGFYTATGELDIEGKHVNTSDEDLGKFGDHLSSLGGSFATFVGLVKDITVPTNMESIRKTVDDFANIAVKLNGITMSYDMSAQMGWFGTHLKDFFSSDKGIGSVTVDNQKVLDVTTAVDKIADIAVKLNGITTIDFIFLQTMLDGVSTLIIPDFTSIGTDAAAALLTGIQNGTATLGTTVKTTASAGGEAARTTYQTWYNAGSYLGGGLGRGIADMASRVQNAAIGVASGAIRSIQMTWAVHSPSRVGADLGMNFDLGIAGGLDTYARVVSQSATGVGNTAVESAQMMLNRMTTNLTDGIDTTPTIRPVIDMSDVQNGVSTINGMFTANRSLSAGAFAGTSINRNAANLNLDGARILNGSGNKDVVEAIQTLTDRFDSLSAAVASMGIVLDTGTLVGQIGTKMDKQLGVLAGRQNRGN